MTSCVSRKSLTIRFIDGEWLRKNSHILANTGRTETVVMKNAAVIGVIMVMLSAGNPAQAAVGEIINGSFEDDGQIYDIAAREPNGWDVNVPANKFGGYVYTDWPADGSYNLTVYSQWFQTFDVNDMATVSQDVYLADVNQIVFDLKLETYSMTPWDPNMCTAVLLIDDNVVWESSNASSDVRGEYFDQTYTVEDKYRDEDPHKLSLGIRVNVAGMLWERYIAQWDFIQCALYCEGAGLSAGDFNRDCRVDMRDLKLVADVWLSELDPHDQYNLFKDDDAGTSGIVNFFDFAIFADTWTGGSSKQDR
jgi:hypothetical protein